MMPPLVVTVRPDVLLRERRELPVPADRMLSAWCSIRNQNRELQAETRWPLHICRAPRLRSAEASH
jgi:hypothetical protein